MAVGCMSELDDEQTKDITPIPILPSVTSVSLESSTDDTTPTATIEACLPGIGEILFIDRQWEGNLVSMDSDGKNSHILMSNAWGGAVWSPDGKLVAVPCGENKFKPDICILNISQADDCKPIMPEKRISLYEGCYQTTGDEVVGLGGGIRSISWSPDNLHLAITCGNRSPYLLCFQSLDGISDCWDRSLDVSYANWSPIDKNKILVQNDEILYLSDSTSSLRTVIGEGYSPIWSTSGRKVAYLSPDQTQIIVSNIQNDGKTIKRVYQLPFIANCEETGKKCTLSWSPDDKYIVFASALENTCCNFHLFRLDIFSGDVIDLTNQTEQGHSIFPNWKP